MIGEFDFSLLSGLYSVSSVIGKDSYLVTDVASADVNDLEDLLWKDNLTFPMGIARHLKQYAAFKTTSTEAYNDKNKHIQHIWGQPRLDKLSSRFLINSALGRNICEYEYSPKNAIIGGKNGPVQDWGANGANMTTTGKLLTKNCLLANIVTVKSYDDHNVILSKAEQVTSPCTTGSKPIYSRLIESEVSYTNQGGFVLGPIQPQLHIGMLATPAINHALETTPTFQQAICYYAVDTYIELVRIDNESFFTLQTAIPRYNDVLYSSSLQADSTKNISSFTRFFRLDELCCSARVFKSRNPRLLLGSGSYLFID